MIKPIANTDYTKRYSIIKYSGYTGVTGVVMSALTGIKNVKIPHKATLHKAGAILAIISIIVHIGGIKHWDRIFDKKQINTNV